MPIRGLLSPRGTSFRGMGMNQDILGRVFEEIEKTIKYDGVGFVDVTYSEEIPELMVRVYLYDDEADVFGYRNEIFTDGKLEPVELLEDSYVKINKLSVSGASFVVKLTAIYRSCGSNSTLAIDVYGNKEIYEKIKTYVSELRKRYRFDVDSE